MDDMEERGLSHQGERQAGAQSSSAVGPSTAPIRIGAPYSIHPRANAMFDACDAGQGLYASPTDPQTFFLEDDDDAPVMTIEQGRGLILGNDRGGEGHPGHQGREYENHHQHTREHSPGHTVSREFSRGSHGSMGSFPPIPEDFVPVNHEEDFTSERFAMAEAAMMANGPAGVPQLDDFGVRYGIAGSSGEANRGMGARVASMPNFSVAMARGTSSGSLDEMVPSPSERLPMPDVSLGTGLRRNAVPKSFSTNDLSSLASKYDVPHAQFLTAPNMRKGKGGRQPKMDPRMDPNIDPKKAKRILANRLSAAKSKLKQKTAMENLKARIQGLEQSKLDLEREIMQLQSAHQAELAMNARLWEIKRERSV